MANLPPRPASPPKLRDDRRPLDDRERDHRAAVPMGSSRPPRPLPNERDRLYVPPRTDTYIPGGYDSRRENDRRDYGSRDRFRDPDRDRERRRDYDRSPKRYSDRERPPFERDRGSYRRASPFRRYGPGPGRRDSRSPPPHPRRRHYRSHSRSRSPSHRSRPRSRSPSPRPSPSKRIRLGNHSIGDGNRSRSPHRRSRSRGRSKSVERRPSTSAPLPSDASQRPNPSTDTLVIKKEEEIGINIKEEILTTKIEETPAKDPSSDSTTYQQPLQSNDLQTETKPSLSQIPSQPETSDGTSPLPTVKTVKVEETKVDIPDSTSPLTPADSKKQPFIVDTTKDSEAKRMDVDSPKLTPVKSSNPTRSPSPHLSRNTTDPQRVNIPTGPQWNRSHRSPPRAPRPRPNAPPSNQHPPHAHGQRDFRRFFSVPGSSLPPPKAESEVLKYEKPKVGWEADISAYETELSKQRPGRMIRTQQDINHVQALQRALHELQMATIDLHAAEGRRRIADFQLDKAKTGSLGIDASDLVEI